MKKTPKEELYKRIRALQGRMESGEIDGALIVQNADLFYFTGSVPQGHLFVPSSGEPSCLCAGLQSASGVSRSSTILYL